MMTPDMYIKRLSQSRSYVFWAMVFALFGVTIGNPQTIQVESALVTVPAVVRDAQGRFIHGLPRDSFKLFEDGRRVPVSLFLTAEDPIKIALLIDTSRSATTVLKKIKKAAQQFVKQMRPDDLVMIAGFDSEMQVLCPLSTDARELKDSINRAKSAGSYTRMRDAIHDIVQGRLRPITGRKAIILLTDGRDQGSRISAQELLRSVSASNTPIYSIFYSVDPRELMKELFGIAPRQRGSGSSWRQEEREAAEYLEQLSDLSAGRLYMSDSKDFDHIFRQISDELRSQYLLGFYPEESHLDGGYHTLVVSVSVPGAVVRSRISYRAAP
jgi:VWFA-related protein